MKRTLKRLSGYNGYNGAPQLDSLAAEWHWRVANSSVVNGLESRVCGELESAVTRIIGRSCKVHLPFPVESRPELQWRKGLMLGKVDPHIL